MMQTTTTRSFLILIALCSLFLVQAGFAQEKESSPAAENKAEVPALTAFHTVIFQLWHNAWPQKDFETLTKLLPEIEKHTAAIAAVKLPGILREKEEAWKTNVKVLQEIAGEYKTAVDKKDQQKLLDAAEKLHSQFENLVQVVRPALKEINAFHETLYSLYHHHLPGFDLEKINVSVSELQTRMAALNQAVLPERHKARTDTFEAARKKLDASLAALAASLPSKDEKKIKAAIETMHSDYEALQGIFD